jgi:hypothetical protein
MLDIATELSSLIRVHVQAGETVIHESARQGDTATTQALIAAGADVFAVNMDGVKPVDLATDEACRDLLEHHATIFLKSKASSAVIIVAALIHWVTLSVSHEVVSPAAFDFSLRSYQLDPSFLWATPAVRDAVVAWARDAFIVQLAVNTPLFSDLPDDCGGDVLEYLDLVMIRHVSRMHMTLTSSPEAAAWVNSILCAAIAVRSEHVFGTSLGRFAPSDLASGPSVSFRQKQRRS